MRISSPATAPRAKRGFSIVIVLGAMLLLMTIAASTLAAVSAGGLGVERREDRKLELLAESVASALRARLIDSAETLPTADPEHLGARLTLCVYNEDLPNSLTVEPSVYTFPEETAITVELSLPSREVYETAAVPAQAEVWGKVGGVDTLLVPAIPRVPARAEVNATLLFRIRISVTQNGTPRLHTIAQTWRLTGAQLEDDGSDPDNMQLTTLGTWELEAHEIVKAS